MAVINKELITLKKLITILYLLSTIGHKSPKNLYADISLKYKVINSNVDPETLHYFFEWQNTLPISVHGPIVNPPVHIELIVNQIVRVQHLKKSFRN